jgi:death on curing protein
LETETVSYISYSEAVFLHIKLMRKLGETRYGVFERSLIESALARPQHAAAYEGADLIRQAATLYLGLIKNHPWVGGNKRTATAITDEFLHRNGIEIEATAQTVVELVLAMEAGVWGIDEVERWLRTHTKQWS